jgi:hypothetical protein
MRFYYLRFFPLTGKICSSFFFRCDSKTLKSFHFSFTTENTDVHWPHTQHFVVFYNTEIDGGNFYKEGAHGR